MNSNEIEWVGSFMLIMFMMRKKKKQNIEKQKGKVEKAFAKPKKNQIQFEWKKKFRFYLVKH